MASNLDGVLADILGLTAVAFQDADRLPSRVFLAPGSAVPWDNCCEDGGQLYLRVVDIYPSGRPFPQPDAVQACDVSLFAVQLVAGTVRCAHTVDNDGAPPTAEQVTSDALTMVEDMAILREALGKLDEVPGVSRFKLGRWASRGPQGGCVAQEWTFHIAISGICWVPGPAED